VQSSQLVVLEAVGWGKANGRVEEVTGDWLSVALFLPPSSDFPKTGEHEAVLEYTTQRGVHHVKGVLRELQPEIDLVVFEERSTTEVVQRREFVRVDSIQPLRVWLGEEGAEREFRTNTINLSGNGMLVKGIPGLGHGDVFWFELRLAEDQAIEGRARAMRDCGDGKWGCRIEEIPERSRDRLIHFIFDLQRRERMTASWEDR
jgi:c-di-GMP-binding flagellar brake protein YcgR